MNDSRERRWIEHDRGWRDPVDALSPSMSSKVDPALLHMRASGGWWELLERLGITLLVTREYEHLIMALTVTDGAPQVSYLPMPHPSGLAVDRRRGVVAVASTRNPNQVFMLEPVMDVLPRADVKAAPVRRRPLMPVRSTIHAGALYMHDLAFIDGELYANSVGQNAIVHLPAGGGSERVWWPRCVERAGVPDVSRNWIQLNSIGAGPDIASSFYSASAATMSTRRPGHLNFRVDGTGVIFSGITREPIARGLTRPHSARLRHGRVWVDNSGYGECGVVMDGHFHAVCRLPGWTRGLCFYRDTAFVGTSRVIPRFARYAPGLEVGDSRCALHALDIDSGQVLGSLVWPQGNQIFAIDWIARSRSAGLPYPMRHPHRGRDGAKRLFYSFDHPRRRPDNE